MRACLLLMTLALTSASFAGENRNTNFLTYDFNAKLSFETVTEAPVKIYAHPKESCTKVFDANTLGIDCSSKLILAPGSLLKTTGKHSISNVYEVTKGLFPTEIDQTKTSYLHFEVSYTNPETGMEERGYLAPKADFVEAGKTSHTRLKWNAKHFFNVSKGIF